LAQHPRPKYETRAYKENLLYANTLTKKKFVSLPLQHDGATSEHSIYNEISTNQQLELHYCVSFTFPTFSIYHLIHIETAVEER